MFKDFLTANREGVVSSAGYLALYLAGVGWGKHLIEKTTTLKEKAKQFGLLGESAYFDCTATFSIPGQFR